MNCTIRVAKTKALISFAVTAKLICVFVFAYANCSFSYARTQLCFEIDIEKQITMYNFREILTIIYSFG